MLTFEMAEAIVRGGRRGALSLTVLHDERCPLCRRLTAWLGRQPTVVPVELLAAGSPEARTRFPLLDHRRTTRVLTVVASDGAVYEGERAWLVCGWSLPSWKPVTEHLGGGIRLGLVGLATRVVDGYRHRLIARSEGCAHCAITAPPVGPPARRPR
jgi:predicted DCC family thiol-disulfide oxidoreductase YuxK